MDTHDTGGNPNYADKDSMFRYLRIRGRVPEGSVVTVEPGIYFCRFILDPLLKDEEKKGFVDEVALKRYWAVGGVRIEGESGSVFSPRNRSDSILCTRSSKFPTLWLTCVDDVLVTKDGYENLTTAVKEREEVERFVNAG